MTSSTNPYAPPLSSSESTNRTRWRIALVVLLFGLGVIGFVSAPLSLMVEYDLRMTLAGSLPLSYLVEIGLVAVGSAFLIVSGVSCWHKRKRSTMAFGVLGMILVLVAGATI